MLVSELREPLRVILGDRDASFYMYEDAALDAGVRTAVRMGLVEGYSLATGNTAITPDVSEPNDLALLLYHTVKLFVQSAPDSQSYRTRAISESMGAYKRFLAELEQSIHELENGTMFSSWQNFSTWSMGLFGADLWSLLSDVTVDRPVATVNVGASGISVS
jgi:hypothetical protein